MDKFKLDWWDKFNEELYCNYLIAKEERMNTYKIIYKYYKGANTDAECCQAVTYVTADDKPEAIKLCGLWQKLIISIEKV